MQQQLNQLKIYKSSAGSGKTFTLVKEYLRLVIFNPDEYKHILAITFTNKATSEMKSRIISSLIELAEGKNEPLKKILSGELPDTDIKANAQKALDNILHDYSNFSVSTIDSFFNRIVRALAREINLPLRLGVQMDTEEVIRDITAKLLSEVSSDKELSGWLSDFLLRKLSEDKGWKLEDDIGDVARQLLKENIDGNNSHNRASIKNFHTELLAIKSSFEKTMKKFGEEGVDLISQSGLSVDDFAQKAKGPAGYFSKIISGDAGYTLNSYQQKGLESAENWCSKSSKLKAQIIPVAEEKLLPLLIKINEYLTQNISLYTGATEALKKIFLLGIVEDLKKKLQDYRSENQLMLISDTPNILAKVISAEETPFVYEKAGTRYHHFLIDEFQDTSDLQWKNLLPLVINSLGGGNFSMVVGDIKQSIYRWRSGNMNLLAHELKDDVKYFRSIIKEEILDTNYRSKKNIVDFNNFFFQQVPVIVSNELSLDESHVLHTAYAIDAKQLVTDKNNSGGRVEVSFISAQQDGEGKIGWKEIAKQKLIDSVHEVASRGYSLGDICVLVRTNRDGDEVASFLIASGIQKVVSPDSLLLTRSARVRFLINTMRYICDNKNLVAKTEILFHHSTHNNSNTALHSVFSAGAKQSSTKRKHTAPSLFDKTQFDETLFNQLMPEEFISNKNILLKLPVYELCERLLVIFKMKNADAYIQRFLDLVLEYSLKHDSSVSNFLFWWDDSPSVQNTAVITPESDDAIRIMTIHSAKGLQFPVVYIPFADWQLTPNARDTIWMSSDENIFSDFGKVPLSPVKALLNSCFKDAYENEIAMAATDSINLLYVAFTRAEEELYVFSPEQSSDNLNSTGKIIRAAIEINHEWKTQLEENETFVLGGNLLRTQKTKSKQEENYELNSFERMKWQEHIQLSTHTDELIEMLGQPVVKAINYGVLVHRVLSSVSNIDEVNSVVEKVFFEGIITADEKENLQKEISELLSQKEIATFFSEEWDVLAERELILSSGELLRPDRVLIKDKRAIVIDFKTGKENSSHQKQVTQYAAVLEQMNYSPVEKFLVYLTEKRVLKVN